MRVPKTNLALFAERKKFDGDWLLVLSLDTLFGASDVVETGFQNANGTSDQVHPAGSRPPFEEWMRFNKAQSRWRKAQAIISLETQPSPLIAVSIGMTSRQQSAWLHTRWT